MLSRLASSASISINRPCDGAVCAHPEEVARIVIDPMKELGSFSAQIAASFSLRHEPENKWHVLIRDHGANSHVTNGRGDDSRRKFVGRLVAAPAIGAESLFSFQAHFAFPSLRGPALFSKRRKYAFRQGKEKLPQALAAPSIVLAPKWKWRCPQRTQGLPTRRAFVSSLATRAPEGNHKSVAKTNGPHVFIPFRAELPPIAGARLQ